MTYPDRPAQETVSHRSDAPRKRSYRNLHSSGGGGRVDFLYKLSGCIRRHTLSLNWSKGQLRLHLARGLAVLDLLVAALTRVGDLRLRRCPRPQPSCLSSVRAGAGAFSPCPVSRLSISLAVAGEGADVLVLGLAESSDNTRCASRVGGRTFWPAAPAGTMAGRWLRTSASCRSQA